MANTAVAATITVCATGCDYATIQGGIDAAVNGDTVLVSDGTYYETINFNGKAVTVTSVNGASYTTIDAGGAGTVVTFASGEGANSVLDGFTITGGVAVADGGGIIVMSASSPIITNNIITGNSATNAGGIVVMSASSPTITNNIITGNSATNAGGVGVSDNLSSPTISNNIITGNTANYGGGVGAVFGASPTITKNIIKDNVSHGVLMRGASPTITNNIITGNTIAGFYIFGPSPSDFDSSTITNNTIFGNATSGSCGGIDVVTNNDASATTITNNIFFGNAKPEICHSLAVTLNVSYSIVEGGYAGIGNIDADPFFVDPANGDYHLQAGSPAIDTGMDTSDPAYGSVLDDIEGTLRPQDGDGLGAGGTGDGSDYDIGTYEYSQQVTTVSIDQIWTEDGTGTWNVVFNPGDTFTVNEAITIQGDPNEVYNLRIRYFFRDAAGTQTLLGRQVYNNYSPGTYYVSLTATVPAGAVPGRGVVRNRAVLRQAGTVLDRARLRGFVNIK